MWEASKLKYNYLWENVFFFQNENVKHNKQTSKYISNIILVTGRKRGKQQISNMFELTRFRGSGKAMERTRTVLHNCA